MVLMFFAVVSVSRHNNRTQIYVSGTTLLRRRFLHVMGTPVARDIITSGMVSEICFPPPAA